MPALLGSAGGAASAATGSVRYVPHHATTIMPRLRFLGIQRHYVAGWDRMAHIADIPIEYRVAIPTFYDRALYRRLVTVHDRNITTVIRTYFGLTIIRLCHENVK